MRESWRWFGPNDPVTINDIRQTGATDIVSALHNVATGEVWSKQAIQAHQALIEPCEDGMQALKWSALSKPLSMKKHGIIRALSLNND